MIVLTPMRWTVIVKSRFMRRLPNKFDFKEIDHSKQCYLYLLRVELFLIPQNLIRSFFIAYHKINYLNLSMHHCVKIHRSHKEIERNSKNRLVHSDSRSSNRR